MLVEARGKVWIGAENDECDENVSYAVRDGMSAVEESGGVGEDVALV